MAAVGCLSVITVSLQCCKSRKRQVKSRKDSPVTFGASFNLFIYFTSGLLTRVIQKGIQCIGKEFLHMASRYHFSFSLRKYGINIEKKSQMV